MSTPRVHRFEVRPAPGRHDPRGDSLLRSAREMGLAPTAAATARIYLVEAELSEAQARATAAKLLADPVTETVTLGSRPTPGHAAVEVHPLPGVMDPAAQSVRDAIRDMLTLADEPCVVTGWRYELAGVSPEDLSRLASATLANPVVHAIHPGAWRPDSLPKGRAYQFKLRHVPIRDLTDEGLTKLSREAHLFLSLDEMQAIRAEFNQLGREPTDIELETLAQTWSEHCVHKTLKSRVRYTPPAGENISWANRPGTTIGPSGTVEIDNLLKRSVAAATHELIASGVDWTLSVFKDNSGVIAFDDTNAVCVKVETHNRPSAIEPYGGAATGIGGCIRDVIGTGLGAKPIASTDVFVVAHPDRWQTLPAGCLHPRRILTDVVAGVRDYGNRMGIPTVAGGVAFDDRHVGNPLVFAGCVGLIPRHLVHGKARAGDLIVALGGRTGRDGIHGATFSSAELESTAATEFAHAVQIGNAIEEKRLLDAILRARDAVPSPLYSAITDCGAGGFSSAVGEMGGEIGAEVHLERAPLKYDGLSYTEVWISEAQERMILAVPHDNLAALQQICDQEHVELAVLGTFGTPAAHLILNYQGVEVGRIPMKFLHDGIPMPTREASWQPASTPVRALKPAHSIDTALVALLKHPTIASKHWIIRQYDHEVQGNTVVKPLVGPHPLGGRGPSDAAVIEPIAGAGRGLAIASGLATGIGDPAAGGDPYLMAIAAVDECVRNLVCVGADPARIAILDNFCWPSCDKPQNMGALVRVCAGCYDAAKAYRTPFVSGKDSLNNQLRVTDPATGRVERVIEIPYTLLISGIAIVPELTRCTTSDAKAAGNLLMLVGVTDASMGGSIYSELFAPPAGATPAVPTTSLTIGPPAAKAVAAAIAQGLAVSAHDCSDGGLLVTAAEMLIGGSTPTAPLGAELDLAKVHADPTVAAFAESASRYLLEVRPADAAKVESICASAGLACARVGTLNPTGTLRAAGAALPVEDLARAWSAPLDW